VAACPSQGRDHFSRSVLSKNRAMSIAEFFFLRKGVTQNSFDCQQVVKIKKVNKRPLVNNSARPRKSIISATKKRE